MGQAVQPTPAGSEFRYERRRPEDTTLYQVVREHLESFLALVEAQTGGACRSLSKTSSTRFWNAAFSRTGFCACAAVRAPTSSWWPSPVSGVDFAPRAEP